MFSAKNLKRVFTLVAALAANQVFSQEISFDTSRVLMSGFGCQKDVDAFVIANGNDLDLYLSNLAINLYSGGGSLTEMKSCIIRIAAKVPRGMYIKSLTQKLEFGVQKTSGTDLTLSSRATIGAVALPMHSVTLSSGAMNEPVLERVRTDQFPVGSQMEKILCSRSRTESLNFQFDIRIAGRRHSPRETLVAQIEEKIHFGNAEIQLAHCAP